MNVTAQQHADTLRGWARALRSGGINHGADDIEAAIDALVCHTSSSPTTSLSEQFIGSGPVKNPPYVSCANCGTTNGDAFNVGESKSWVRFGERLYMVCSSCIEYVSFEYAEARPVVVKDRRRGWAT